MKESYVAYVLQNYVLDGNFDAQFGSEWIDVDQFSALAPKVCDYAFAQYGIDAGGKYADEASALLQTLLNNHAIVVLGDEYAGYWYTLRTVAKNKLIKEFLVQNPVSASISTLGEEALRRALTKIVVEDGLRPMEEKWGQEGVAVPQENSGGEADPGSQNVPNPNFFNSEAGRNEFVSLVDKASTDVEDSGLSNTEKSQAQGYLIAAKALAGTPEPPVDLIWQILNRANSIAGIGSFFLALITLIALAV